MTTISASEARQTLPAQLDRVEAGQEVAITRHGRVVAVLVSPESLSRRRAADAWATADRYADLLDAAREAALPSPPLGRTAAEELLRDVARGREAR